MDDALTRTDAGGGQREYALPTADAFAHMTTAPHYQSQSKSKCPPKGDISTLGKQGTFLLWVDMAAAHMAAAHMRLKRPGGEEYSITLIAVAEPATP